VKAARRGAIPSIWFYAENDRFWGAKLPRAWHAAYVEAGGTAEFHMLPPLPEDGHEIIGSGYEHWRPRLDHFLTSMGFAPRKLPGVSCWSDHCASSRVDAQLASITAAAGWPSTCACRR
jgi:hypothetical protein